MRNVYRILVTKNLNGSDHLGDMDAYGRIILKWK
jgi:hypothetical protein